CRAAPAYRTLSGDAPGLRHLRTGAQLCRERARRNSRALARSDHLPAPQRERHARGRGGRGHPAPPAEMRKLLASDLPPRSAAAVVALALLASAVTGGEKPRTTPQEPRAAAVRAGGAPADFDLDLEALKRAPREGEVQDLFANRAPATAAPPPAASP